jgi:hypothetical protein
MIVRNKLAAGLVAAGLIASSGALIACDREVNELEEEVDENVDTDGQDDQ